jgi:peptide/nickel transport system substrate-binding protein
MPTRRSLLQAASLLAASTPVAQAQKAADMVRVAWRDSVPQFDPYRSALRSVLVMAAHLFDTLVYRDPDTLQIQPLLARSWLTPAPQVLELTLRDDVRFHDGSALRAEDVVYTVQVAGEADAPLLDLPVIGGAEVIGPLQVRLHLLQPVPLALEYLATVLPILPKATREQAAESFADKPVGTGPYKLGSKQGNQVVLLANDRYFAGGPKGKPTIGRLLFRTVPDPTAVITALVKGDADWIWEFDPAQFPALSRAPNLDAVEIPSMRFGYLSIDAMGRSDTSKPFTDMKVRQAVACAIDRTTLARHFGANGTTVLDTPCSATQFGCDAAMATRYVYDPARARNLLAAAGFPDGFATRMVSYVLPQWTGDVQNYLSAVGIDVTVQQVEPAVAGRLLMTGQAPLMLGTWGSASINDSAAVLPHFFGGGPMDQAHDAALIALMQQSEQTANPDQRRGLYADAIRRITSQALWLPMFAMSATYAFTKGLKFHATSDEIPRFYMASWT